MSASEKDVEKDADSVLTKEVQEAPDSSNKERDVPKLVLDTGKEHVRYRRHWWQLWYVAYFLSP